MCPVLVTAIEDVATRPDLQDRTITLRLPNLAERRQESLFWLQFDEAAPRILGAIFDAVSAALRRLTSVSLSEPPRLADFAVWVTAAEPSLGLQDGEFMRAYNAHLSSRKASMLETSLFAGEVVKFVKEKGRWEGTAARLLDEVNKTVDRARRDRSWPSHARKVRSVLDRYQAVMREHGIEYVASSPESRKPGTGERNFKLSVTK